MQILERPLNIFITQKRFNDRTADDMQYGDMNEQTLKSRYRLDQISSFVDWITYQSPYNHPVTRNLPVFSKEKAISMLFDELRSSSWAFSFYGPYQGLITSLFNHMQYKNGTDFNDARLDQAYKNLIENDHSSSSVLNGIKFVLGQFDFSSSMLTKDHFYQIFKTSHLPKYVHWKNWINGMGISIHDINSTEITIESITLQNKTYTATIKYKAQDHFGLDRDDISKLKFNSISFFRIWFVLQRLKEFAYKPFFTNFEAKITITGELNV